MERRLLDISSFCYAASATYVAAPQAFIAIGGGTERLKYQAVSKREKIHFYSHRMDAPHGKDICPLLCGVFYYNVVVKRFG